MLDGLLFALMVGASESYFGACAVALGHTDTALALLATLPLFAGSLGQAGSGVLVLWLGSRKRVVLAGVLVQALSHIGLIALAWQGSPALGPLLGFTVLYFVSGMVAAPAWGAWMGGLTENIDRERYFAMRSAVVAAGIVVSFVWAGYHLRDGALSHGESHTYALLFTLGFVARLGSAAMLFLQPEPSAIPRDSLLRVLARTRSVVRGDGFRLVLGCALLGLGAQISIPFYAPYMLKTLALGYDGFAKLVAVQLVAKAMILPVTHRIAARFGLPRLLAFSILLIALVAWLWGATGLYGIVLAQFLSGIAWAFYEFASFQLLLGSARPSHRVEFLAVAASLSGIMQLTGALLGSFLLTRLGLGYRGVFLVSALARALPLCLFLPPLWAEMRRGSLRPNPNLAPAPGPGE